MMQEHLERDIIKSIELLLDDDEPIGPEEDEHELSSTSSTSIGSDFSQSESPFCFSRSGSSREAIDGRPIENWNYGGSQPYSKWSTVESDELTEPPPEFHMHHSTPKINEINQKPMEFPTSPPKSPTNSHFNQMAADQSKQLLNHYLLQNLYKNYLMNAAAAGPFSASTAALNLLNYKNLQYNPLMQRPFTDEEIEYLKLMNYYSSMNYYKAFGMATGGKGFCQFHKKSYGDNS